MKLLVRPRHQTQAEPLVSPRAIMRIPADPMRVLDLDTEARPLHWISGYYVSKEITAIAWAWTDAPEDVTCSLLGETDPMEMLRAFTAVDRQAHPGAGALHLRPA